MCTGQMSVRQLAVLKPIMVVAKERFWLPDRPRFAAWLRKVTCLPRVTPREKVAVEAQSVVLSGGRRNVTQATGPAVLSLIRIICCCFAD